MNKFVMTAVAAAALIAGPMAVSAQSIAASLSASFGDNTATSAELTTSNLSTTRPTSVSVAGAVGVNVAVNAAASAAASTAGAISTELDTVTASAMQAANGGFYTTNIGFDVLDPADVSVQIDEAIDGAFADFCENGLNTTGPITIERTDNLNTIEGNVTMSPFGCTELPQG